MRAVIHHRGVGMLHGGRGTLQMGGKAGKQRWAHQQSMGFGSKVVAQRCSKCACELGRGEEDPSEVQVEMVKLGKEEAEVQVEEVQVEEAQVEEVAKG